MKGERLTTMYTLPYIHQIYDPSTRPQTGFEAGRHSRGGWRLRRHLGWTSGRDIWEWHLGEASGRDILEWHLGETSGRDIWERHLAETSGRDILERHQEASGGHLRHLEVRYHKPSLPFEQNANSSLQLIFYEGLLSVTSIMTAYLQQLMVTGSAAGMWDRSWPLYQYRENPYS